jgi:acetoacetyl-CoA synthetase
MNGANGQFLDSQNGTNVANGTSKSPKMLWKHPSPKSTAMYEFLEHVNKKYSLQLSSFEELHKWSTEETGDFWGTCWDHLGIRAKSQPPKVRFSLCL